MIKFLMSWMLDVFVTVVLHSEDSLHLFNALFCLGGIQL